MKKVLILFVVAVLFSGCANFKHSESISATPTGAVGSFSRASGSSSFPLHFIQLPRQSRAQGNPIYFARSLAMINYSTKLKSIGSRDECGGIIYEFERPVQKSYKSDLPPNFGREPVVD